MMNRGDLMIRIAVVDDDKIFAKQMQTELKSLFQNKNIISDVLFYIDPEKFLHEYNNNPFDLIYLDIDMPKMSGIKLASMIRKNETDTHIIFVSSYSHFVFNTFQYAPYRFIRKEKLLQELSESVDSYCEEIFSEKQLINLQFENNTVEYKDITKMVYFYSLRHDIFLFYDNQSKRLANRAYTMDYLEEFFKPYGFIRVHKTYLVNCRYVYQIRNDQVILNYKSERTVLPLSARRMVDVKEQFKLLMRGGDAL